MCSAISRVDFDYMVQGGLCISEKTIRRFVFFPTVRLLGHIKADQPSVGVKDRIILIWK